MKKFVISIVSMLCCFGVFAQDGIKFEDLSFAQALEKAKKENKLLFIDAFTSWCGPCKMMANNIFPQKAVGEFMNEHFVNVKYDMEKGEGPELMKKYSVEAFPTFLIIQPNGDLQHRVVGGTDSAEEFVEWMAVGLDETKALGALESRYKAGDRSVDFIKNYTDALIESYDYEAAQNIANDFIAHVSEKDRMTEPYWFIYESNVLSPINSDNLNFVLENINTFSKNVGEDKIKARLSLNYEDQFENILRKRDRTTTLEEVAQIEKIIKDNNLPNQELLLDYAAMVRAFKTDDTAELLRLAKKIFPILSDLKLNYLYYNPALSILKNATPEQHEEIIELSKQIIEKAEDNRLKISMTEFVRSYSNKK